MTWRGAGLSDAPLGARGRAWVAARGPAVPRAPGGLALQMRRCLPMLAPGPAGTPDVVRVLPWRSATVWVRPEAHRSPRSSPKPAHQSPVFSAVGRDARFPEPFANAPAAWPKSWWSRGARKLCGRRRVLALPWGLPIHPQIAHCGVQPKCQMASVGASCSFRSASLCAQILLSLWHMCHEDVRWYMTVL